LQRDAGLHDQRLISHDATSRDATEGAAAMADDPTPKADPNDEPKDDQKDLGDAGKKALEEERKARRDAEKQLKAVNDRVRELEDKDKSDSEKLTSRVAELEKELSTERSRAMRLEVAIDKGLTKTQARRLVGDTEDDLVADADDLLSSFKPSDETKPAPPGSIPKENLRPGAAPDTPEPTKEDIRKAIDAIPR
jgi:chromosome segregation ATPase